MSADIQSGQKKKRKRQVSRLKAISRNEKYLSKLSGEEEVVPKPISREERYMYRACGYVDRPIPEHAISREEKYWKKIIENGGGGSAVLTSKDITENGLYYAADDEADGYSSVNVDVPNTYLLSDEGKVVSNGTLVSQTSSSVTQNGVVDTTLIDSINVSVNNSYTQQDEGKVVNSGRLISQTSSTAGQNGIVDTTLINSLNVNVPDTNTTSGILPYVIHTSETALRSWTIYGNNYEHTYSADHTLPLTFSTNTAGNADDWSISGNDNVGKNLLKITGTTVEDHGVTFTINPIAGTVIANGTATNGQGRYAFYINLSETQNVYLSGCPEGGSSSTYNLYPWDSTAGARPKKWDGTTAQSDSDYGTSALEVQALAGHNVSCTIRIEQGYTANNLVFKPMYRLADTSADFEPYQVGVGQRTVNLFDKNNVDDGYYIDASGNIASSGSWAIAYIPAEPSTTYSTKSLTDRTSAAYIGFCNSAKQIVSIAQGSVTSDRTFTTNAGTVYIALSVRIASNADTAMLVKGSTAPSTYVPYGYEIPISLQGGNLFDKDATDVDKGFVENKYLKSNNTMVGNANWNISEYIDVQSLAKYLLVYGSDNETPGVCYYTSEKEYISGLSYNNQTDIILSIPSNAKYIRFSYMKGAGINPVLKMLTDYTFYIGSTPLTAGQSISKTSTGVDITAVQGTNTITTDLYNKPEMSIEGVDYVGVGERSGNDWQIPLTVSDGTSTTSVNVPIDAPLTEGESITDTQTISTFTGENTIDTSLTNKPNMDTVYIDEYNNLINKTITQNGTYSAADDSASGYSKVTVNVPAPPAPMLITKTITASGIYTAASDNADGYSEVTVNIRPYSEVLDQGLQAVVQEEE